jgi:hypothetical protein
MMGNNATGNPGRGIQICGIDRGDAHDPKDVFFEKTSKERSSAGTAGRRLSWFSKFTNVKGDDSSRPHKSVIGSCGINS